MRKVFLLSILISTLFLLTSVSAYVYDDFSGTTLNLTKWSLSKDPSYGWPDEYFINTSNEVYHIKETNSQNLVLEIINHSFQSGDILEYNIYYRSGSGNILSYILLNGVETDGIIGAIGYWNGEMSMGNIPGHYHMMLVFTTDGANVELTKPDSSVFIANLTGFTPPYTFAFGTTTGHNGLLHFDYDNFVINEIQAPTTTSTTTTTTTIPITTTTIPGCYVYDDFSGNTLDLTKWNETQDPEGQPLTDEHFLDTLKQVYHIQQNTSEDKRTVLNLIGHTFQPEEQLEYDVDYVNGSGNRAIVLFVNGGPVDRLLRDSLGCQWCGSIGFNGQEFDIGNDFGTYHYKLEFFDDGINLTVTRPNMSIYYKHIPVTTWNYAGQTFSSEPPYNIGFETWSSGSVHADYDNFIICEAQPTTTTTTTSTTTTTTIPFNHTELIERVEELEGKVEGLENKTQELQNETQSNTDRIGILETTLNNLNQTINTMQTVLNDFMNDTSNRISILETVTASLTESVNNIQLMLNDFISKIITYLTNLPRGLRKQMICGYMIDNNITEYSDLGLTCELIEKGKKVNCKCSPPVED